MKAVLPILGLLAACEGAEPTYTQFNASGESLEITVGGTDVTSVVALDLHSTTGATVVASAQVDPGGGPVGTLHTVEVEIDEIYAHVVDRVSLAITAPGHPDRSLDLRLDSAVEGLYSIEILSSGEEDESRSDTFLFELWDLEGDDDAAGVSNDTGGA